MTTQIDSKITAMFAKVSERKAKCKELRQQISAPWKTNCSFIPLGATVPVNIQTASAEMVYSIATTLGVLIVGATCASENFGLTITVKIQGYVPTDWFTDLKKRLAAINIRDEEKQLADIEERLTKVLSPEEQRRLEVEMLAKEIGLE